MTTLMSTPFTGHFPEVIKHYKSDFAAPVVPLSARAAERIKAYANGELTYNTLTPSDIVSKLTAALERASEARKHIQTTAAKTTGKVEAVKAQAAARHSEAAQLAQRAVLNARLHSARELRESRIKSIKAKAAAVAAKIDEVKESRDASDAGEALELRLATAQVLREQALEEVKARSLSASVKVAQAHARMVAKSEGTKMRLDGRIAKAESNRTALLKERAARAHTKKREKRAVPPGPEC